MASQAPPSIPPRPSRTKSPNPATETPAIPPRPARPSRAKSPSANLPSPSPSPEREPAPTTIAQETALHAPVARAPTKQPVTPKSLQASSAPPSIYNNRIGGEDYEKESGIPQIGRRVPMHPNAGDVQAPTPSATPSGGWKKHVYREEWEMDEGAYGQTRRETPYSMSSSDLNQVVAHPSGPGVGVESNTPAVPDEEVGYLASEEYSRALSRAGTPAQAEGEKSSSIDREENDHSVIHLDPPSHGTGYLRRGNSDFEGSTSQTSLLEVPAASEEGENEDDNEYPIIAEDEALKRRGMDYMQPAISPVNVQSPRRPSSHPRSRPQSGVNQDLEEKLPHREFSTPLEALDALEEAEGTKPLFSDDEDGGKGLEKLKPKNLSVEKLKRPELSEQRFPSNDIWEEAPEYSQLEATVDTPSPDTEMTEEDRQAQRTVPQRHHSNQPDLKYVQGQPHHHYEPGDEQEFERKQREGIKTIPDYRLNLQNQPQDERLKRLLRNKTGDEESDSNNGRRAASRAKFPSNDIWEDVPPSLDLTSTISSQPERERATTGDASSIPADAAPGTERPTTGTPLEDAHVAPQQKPIIPARPSIPSRPPQRERKLPPATIPPPPAKSAFSPRSPSPEKKERPTLPERPKPKIPVRPAKPAGIVRTPSSEAASSPAADKPKPAVPPRTGGKIAALKAGFLGDLESRLKLGPGGPPPKKEEKKVEEEKTKPLEDVRKSRARGPRGRKLPTKEEKVEPAAKAVGQQEIAGVWTVWAVDEELDAVVVGSSEKLETIKAEIPEPREAEKAPEKEPEKEDSKTEAVDEKPIEKAESGSNFTTTLPGVSGTAEQAIPAITESPSSPIAEQPSQPAAKEENPTMIPTGQHPEDAFEEGEKDNREDTLRALARQESYPDSEGPNTPLPSRQGSIAGLHGPAKREVVPLERVDEGLQGGLDVERDIKEGDA